MSYTSLSQQIVDPALMRRLDAAAHKEARNNAELGATDYGRAVLAGQANPPNQLGWPLCIATEAPYEYALNAGNDNPGGDPTVITDEDILAAVQANWPPDPWPPPAPVPGGV